ncbi:hypothetical protein ATK36_4901 [Amycolatopsis sulphurea]|uniref:Uncharacterized protein n=1 Tax=Amycolatopsis sulphurea TaxID=76022 RepID=A0A2A9FE46_9PSEU|nr:hypothetical protein ATK36_4901 [Amycolatopsis sulphurea]
MKGPFTDSESVKGPFTDSKPVGPPRLSLLITGPRPTLPGPCGRPQRYVRRYRDYHYYLSVATLLLGGVVLTARFDLQLWNLLGWGAVLGLLIGTACERNRDRREFVAATTYLVTDRRLIFVSQGEPGIEFRWIGLADLRPPRVQGHGDGIGTIDFHPTALEWLKDQGYRSGPRGFRSCPS